MRWSLHFCPPGDAFAHIFTGDSLDAVLAEAERKLRVGARLLGIFDATELYLNDAQIKRTLESRTRGRSLTVARPKKKTTKRGR
jgi:hypothetical protein